MSEPIDFERLRLIESMLAEVKADRHRVILDDMWVSHIEYLVWAFERMHQMAADEERQVLQMMRELKLLREAQS